MATASPGTLWVQAYRETKDLPSFERGEKCRARYRELLTEHGLLVRREPGDDRTLPCGWPGNRSARQPLIT
jgi:hypothetical protein